MFGRVLLLVLVASIAPYLSAEEAKPSPAKMKDSAETVIRQQLEAFRRNDYAAAYTFAAPALQQQFSREAFEKMVRSGYPLIATSTEAVIGLTIDDGEKAIVTVRVIGEKKEAASFQYLMERHEGRWRIAGVFKLDEEISVI
jgi:hypothetical protein